MINPSGTLRPDREVAACSSSHDRPELDKALLSANMTGDQLVVTKPDRVQRVAGAPDRTRQDPSVSRC
jgi:DNA invertase Pin-like site-specific DNA recombinase